MEEALKNPSTRLFESKPVDEEILLKVHKQFYIREVQRSWYYKGASLAVGGCVEAATMIARGELTNALVFSVGAGHHCGPSSGWGGTYLSCTGPAVAAVRSSFNQVVLPLLIPIVITATARARCSRTIRCLACLFLQLLERH
jgi:acetoin utilization deacetylase AcuC-like enzyme